MKNYPYKIPSSNQVYLEFVDKFDNPLMLLPQKQILQQKLAHRKVYLVLQDEQSRTLLIRSNKNQSLSIPSTSVYAGEAREHASLRLLKRVCNLRGELPFYMQAQLLDCNKLNTFFICIIDEKHKIFFNDKVLWLDFTEQQGFVSHFSDMLSEELFQFITQGHLEQLYSLNSKFTV